MFSTDMECCLWAYHDRLLETHALKSSFWRKQSGEEMQMADLLEYVGASKNRRCALALELQPPPEAPEELPQAGVAGAPAAPAEEDGAGLQTGLSGPRRQQLAERLVVFGFLGVERLGRLVGVILELVAVALVSY